MSNPRCPRVRKKRQQDLNGTERASVQGTAFGVGAPAAVTEAVGSGVWGFQRRGLWGRTQCRVRRAGKSQWKR